MCATVLRLFDCLASSDGPLIYPTRSFSDIHLLGALLKPSLPSRVEREETLNCIRLYGGAFGRTRKSSETSCSPAGVQAKAGIVIRDK